MAKLSLVKGTTSKLIDVFIADSSSTTGAGLTGLVFNTASLTGYYYREGAASATAITLATMTLGTWATGGFVVVDGTNMPGCYQLGIPNAAIASGANSAIVMLKGATNMAPVLLEIELTGIDNQDAVHGGMSALPNAASAASGGLLTVGTGSGQISPTSGSVSTTFAIKKNTALNNFEFPMFASSDHVTPQGGLTGISGDVSIDGGGFTALTNTASIAEVGTNTGVYKINLAQADTNGNTLTFRFIKSGTDTTIIGVITQS